MFLSAHHFFMTSLVPEFFSGFFSTELSIAGVKQGVCNCIQMTFFWSKVCGPLGKTSYIYPRYQVWGVTDLGFDFALYHPPYQIGKIISA